MKLNTINYGNINSLLLEHLPGMWNYKNSEKSAELRERTLFHWGIHILQAKLHNLKPPLNRTYAAADTYWAMFEVWSDEQS